MVPCKRSLLLLMVVVALLTGNNLEREGWEGVVTLHWGVTEGRGKGERGLGVAVTKES